ncbi:MAG: hypothetical protein R6U96_16410 [Promethearchaeia archaeon]
MRGKTEKMSVFLWSEFLVLVIFPLVGTLISLYGDNALSLPRLFNYPLNFIFGIPFLIWGFFWAGWAMIFGYIFLWIGLGILINSFFLTFGFSSLVTTLLIIYFARCKKV